MNISKEALQNLKDRFPVGCRVRLTKMEDVQAPPIGTYGTVVLVDSIGSIHVAWDTGSSLAVVYGEDSCVRVNYNSSEN